LSITYPPLNTLKAAAENVWVVDGPAIHFGLPLLGMQFPTRMTVVRLSDRRLFIHSPTPLLASLAADVLKLGQPCWIIAPNRLHYWWVTDWQRTFPDAQVYLAPRVEQQARGRVDFRAYSLGHDRGYPWDPEIATLGISGRYMTEYDFFHHASRTLILTDLIENFESAKLGSWLSRLLTKIGGVRHPDGSMPRDMRTTFPSPTLRAAVETMMAWNPERVILAHGRWYQTNGAQELRRAFRWLLDH